MVIGLSVLAAALVSAATPDEDYVRIYKSIVDADQLRDSGQRDAATRTYNNAREALRQLQVTHPAWNERLVIYRLNYINTQLKTTAVPPAAPNLPAAAPASPLQPASPSPIGVPPTDQQLQQLRDENQALRLATARLEAKLREALSTQPPSTDPVELSKVQEQLKELSKAHDLLKSVLAAEQQKPPQTITNVLTNVVERLVINTVTNQVTNTLTTVITNKIVAESPELAQLRSALTNQVTAVSALRSENEVLKKELTQARQTPPPPAPLNPQLEQQLQTALKELKSMQESNQELVRNQSALEKKLADAARTQTEQSDKLKQYESMEKDLTTAREEGRRLTETKEALEKKLAESVAAKVPESESGRRIMKLERDLLESQSEIRLLTRQKATLEQRLAESRLAAEGNAGPSAGSPTSIVPGAGGVAASTEIHRQLKQAAWEVLNLQTANADLVRKQTTMEQQLAKAGSSSTTFDAIDQDRLRRLETMNRELTDSRQATLRLEQENQALSRQLADARQSGGGKPDPAKRQLAEAQERIRQAEQANRDLLKRTSELERQIAEARSGVRLASSPAGGDAQRLDRLQQELATARESAQKLATENQELERRLASADSPRTAPRAPARASSRSNLERELVTLRSKLAAIEAASVPYTEQELALFGRLEVNLAATTPESTTAAGGGTPAGASAPPPSAVALITDARKDFDAGNYAVAEQKFQEVLKSDTRNLYTLAHLAAAQFEQSKLAEAEKTVQRALEVNPDDAPSLYLMGIIRLRQERSDEALDLLSRSARSNPQNAITQNSLGVALSQKGMREPAETAFRRALQIRPDYPDAHYNLAVEYVLQDPPAFKLAQWHYQKAVSNGHPSNAELEKRLSHAAASASPVSPSAAAKP